MGSGGGDYISPGDTIVPEVIWATGSTYYVYTTDSTTGKQCAPNSSPYTFSHTPYFEDFIVERSRLSGGGLTHLAKFDTETIYGKVEWGTTLYPISRPDGDGWANQILMQNSGVTSMCSGAWSSPTCSDYVLGGITANTWGRYTATWLSSQYT